MNRRDTDDPPPSSDAPAGGALWDDPVRAYAVLESLLAAVPAGGAAPAPRTAAEAPTHDRLSALSQLALRAALAPPLQPYRADPLLTLNGRFVSIDAQIEALLLFCQANGYLPGLIDSLPASDRRLLPPGCAEQCEPHTAPVVPALPPQSALLPTGTIWGSLYLPAARLAAPCRISAVYDPRWARPAGRAEAGSGWRWPAPTAVRPVSADIASAAQDALTVALALLSRHSAALLDAPLSPGPVYYDVCCPDRLAGRQEADGAEAYVAGRSLGLPLALAFLSALSGLPIAPLAGATGALEPGGTSDAVLPVEWTADKAAAHLALGSGARFVTPEPASKPSLDPPTQAAAGSVLPATDIGAAARSILPGFADRLDSVGRDASGGAASEIVPPAGGNVVFLRTVIDGAVRLWEEEPAEMRRAVASYEALFREIVRALGGYVFGAGAAGGATGALSAAFVDVSAACTAALEVQQGLLLRRWPEAVGDLRIGGVVHRGEATLFHGDYYGPALAQTGRLADAVNGGQILLSEPARRGLALSPETDWRIVELGKHRLRDLGEAIALFQLSRQGLPEILEPPRTLDGRQHNLPVQATSFIGRDEEIATLFRLLIDEGARLVTLSGPGGVGKTRLALQVAAACAAAESAFDGGVWFLSVADSRSRDDVIAAVAQALGAPAATSARSLADQIAAKLEAAPGRTLLLLDNLESALPDAASFLSDLLAAAPRCTILATSQVVLNLRAERRFEVTPLPVPSDADAHRAAELARESPAIALFRARAQEVSPGFDHPADEGGDGLASLPLLRAICARLDGLPLAIELAAARVRHLSLTEIERRLEDAFPLLQSRAKDTPARQRTLLATLHWSYDLLDPEEREFFARLSVFAGGFTEEAAAAVTGRDDAFDLLTALEEKSLVRCDIGRAEGDQSTRYYLLNMVQVFARQRLDETGDEARIAHAAHAAYYARLVRTAAPALDTPDEVRAFDSLEREIDNLRAAYACLAASDPNAIPAFVADAGEFARRRGYWREWLEWPRHALALATEAVAAGRVSPFVEGRLLLFIATAGKDADVVEAERHVEAALACSLQPTDTDPAARRLRADALNQKGVLLIRRKRYAEATAILEESRAHYRALALERGEARALNNLGLSAHMDRDYDRARRHYGESAELCRRTGDRRGLYHATNNVGLMALNSGQHEAARDSFREALTLAIAQKDAMLIGVAMMNLGDSLGQCGEPHAALSLLVAAESVFTRLGHSHRNEAAKSIDRCCEAGEDLRVIVERLRSENGRKSLAELLTMESQPEPVRLNLVPKIIY